MNAYSMGIKVELPERQLKRVEAITQNVSTSAKKATANVRNGLIGAAFLIGGVWLSTTIYKRKRS